VEGKWEESKKQNTKKTPRGMLPRYWGKGCDVDRHRQIFWSFVFVFFFFFLKGIFQESWDCGWMEKGISHFGRLWLAGCLDIASFFFFLCCVFLLWFVCLAAFLLFQFRSRSNFFFIFIEIFIIFILFLNYEGISFICGSWCGVRKRKKKIQPKK